MMKRNDWETAFGDIPGSFSTAVNTTVARMQRKANPKSRRKPALVLAAAIVVVTSTALALSQFGVLDLLQGNLRAFLQPGATQLVQTNITQTAQQPHHATFTVEEAINDGHQMYVVVRVHGDSDVLLMDYEAETSWPTDWWQYGNSEETYSKRAYDTNRMLVQACAFAMDSDENMLPASPMIHYDGEDILYTLSFPANGTDAALMIDTFEMFTDDKPHSDRMSSGRLDISVPLADTRSFYEAATPVDLPAGNMRLTKLTVEQTSIATYMTCEYEAADGAPGLTHINLLDGVWVNWLDESGQPYPEGENTNWLKQTETGQTRLETVYRAFDTMPDTVTLRFFNGMTGETFDTVTVALHPITEEEN